MSRVAINSQEPGQEAVGYKLQGCKLSNLRTSKDAHVSSNTAEHYKATKLQICKNELTENIRLYGYKHIPHSLMAHEGLADIYIYIYVSTHS